MPVPPRPAQRFDHPCPFVPENALELPADPLRQRRRRPTGRDRDLQLPAPQRRGQREIPFAGLVRDVHRNTPLSRLTGHRRVDLPTVRRRERQKSTLQVALPVRPSPNLHGNASQLGLHVGRYHHYIGPRLQKLSRLAVRDPATTNDYATLTVEVEENRVKNSAFVLDLRLQINVPGWRESLAWPSPRIFA